jgi:hypothetical protein
LGGRSKRISEFEASLVYKVEFQDSQGYAEKPCLKKKKKKIPCVVYGIPWFGLCPSQEGLCVVLSVSSWLQFSHDGIEAASATRPQASIVPELSMVS